MSNSFSADRPTYDVAIVGASIAGCTAATLMARRGARVALLEREVDPTAFKPGCGHYIQPPAVATLERLGALDAIMEAGAVRSRLRRWTLMTSAARRHTDPRSGWLEPSPGGPAGLNLRRQHLDPLLRSLAAATPGVELMLGRQVTGLLRDGDRITGLELADGSPLRARLVVGADGSESTVARMAGTPARRSPNARFAYTGHFEGPAPAASPDGSLWFLDPHWAAAFPTDSGLTRYVCMPTDELLPDFRRNPEEALVAFLAGLPDAPPIRDSRLVGAVVGEPRLANLQRRPVGPGVALIGDAALTTDPLWGAGCGWACSTGEWLANAVTPALRGREPLERGLRRYSLQHARRLWPHAIAMNTYSSGRPLAFPERVLLTAGSLDPGLATRIESLLARSAGPEALLTPGTIARTATASLRRWIGSGVRAEWSAGDDAARAVT